MRPLAALVAVLVLAGFTVAESGQRSEVRAAGAGAAASAPGASTAPPGVQLPDSDLPKTWAQAQVFLRYEDDELNLRVISGPLNQPYIQRLLALHVSDPQPVIIHLHGCGRTDDLSDIRTQGRAMAELGYVVIAPDSFARESRPNGCDFRSQTRDFTAPLAQIQQWRIEELAYALSQVLEAPWADKLHIFAGGFDEGGDAVLAFTDPALAGRFAISPPCRFQPHLAGKLPTLIITSGHDIWFNADHEPEAQGRCRQKLRGEPNVSLFESDGVLHDALIYEESRITLWNFLVRASFL
jgi:dienelactone hydrolase